MVEQQTQVPAIPTSVDAAAQKRGAIKGILAGTALLLVAATITWPVEEPGGWGQLFRSWLFLTVAGGAVGWYLPRVVAAEQSSIPLKWQRAALFGGGVGLLFILLVLAPLSSELFGGSKELWLAVALSSASVIAMSALVFALGYLVVASASARKRTLRILGWSLALVIALIAAVIAINIPDEDLLPAAKSALTPPGDTVKDADNGFFVLVGIDAPAAEDAHAFGRKVVSLWDSEARKPRKDRKFDTTPLYGGKRLAVNSPKGMGKFCDWDKGNCLVSSTSDWEIAQRFLTDNATWVERYRSLMNYPKYEEHIPLLSDAPLPRYSNIFNVSKIRKAHCAAQVQNNQPGSCLQILSEDIRIARTQLAGSRTLLGKMVAIGLLRRDYRVLAELMSSQPDAVRSDEPLITAMLAPLSKDEMDLTRAISSEFSVLPSLLDDMHDGEPGGSIVPRAAWLLLGKKNASLNLLYRDLAIHAEFSRLPAAQKFAQRAMFKERSKALVPLDVSPSWLYNPFGKMMFVESRGDYEPYALRLDDLDGQQRLLRLQWQIVAQRIAPEQVPEFLKSAGSEYANPYTGKPMDWNPQTRTLSFTGVQTTTAGPPHFDARI